MFIFQNFPVYQKAETLYQEIVPYIAPQKVRDYLKDQLERALSSIVLNIAEGSGKVSRKDKKNFYVIARGSCHECAAILNLLRCHQLDLVRLDHWSAELVVIGKMLSGIIKSLEKPKEQSGS